MAMPTVVVCSKIPHRVIGTPIPEEETRKANLAVIRAVGPFLEDMKEWRRHMRSPATIVVGSATG